MTMAQSYYPLRVMTWNVENLFDTIHDEGFQDEEFLPQAARKWTKHRYWKKLTDLSRVIAAVSEDGGIPDLIGMCEVENDSVLTTLTKRSVLRNLGYSYVMTQCEDARGIDVALLYQPSRFKLLEQRAVRVPSKAEGLRPTRDILYAKGLVLTNEGTDTLHVFVVHLPSRTGGHEGDQNRRLAAQTLWNVVDSVDKVRERTMKPAHILAMGDFNADHRDRIFRHAPLRLTDDPKCAGTYCFQGFWQWIDHILVSESVETKGMAKPIQLPWLMEENKTYSVPMPRRTFRGPTYHGGVSDHLPVLLDISIK